MIAAGALPAAMALPSASAAAANKHKHVHFTAVGSSRSGPSSTFKRPPIGGGPMRRALVAAIAVIGLVIVTGLSAHAVAAPKRPTKRAFAESATGALISIKGLSFEGVLKVTSSVDGTGAGIEDGSVTASAFPLSGKITLAEYFADGVQKLKETYKLGAPNANGIETITGNGKCIGGTGVHQKEKCTYTVRGTTNSKTNVDTVKVTGTYTR